MGLGFCLREIQRHSTLMELLLTEGLTARPLGSTDGR